jgi:hypothetical protein
MSMPKRLLALEIRASRFGFAVLEGSTRLLDWGVRSFGEQNERIRSAVSDRIATLLAFHKPAAVVVRARKYDSAVQNKGFLRIVAAIRTETTRGSSKFFVLTASQVRSRFGPNRQVTKHDIAASLAKQFEELSWKLPGRRKPYQSEAPAMLVFDAIANGVAFFARQTSGIRREL